MIKNIIFDMGNVLARFDPEMFLDRVGVTDAADRALLMREVYRSLEWARMDRGSLTDEEAAELMCGRLPERLHETVRSLTCRWDRPILPVPGMKELAAELKEKGYGVFLLSNASLRQHEYWGRIPGSEYFDGTVVSADVGLVKPQPEIFALACERFSLVPGECVFIDDSTLNAEGAFYYGMNAVVFHDDVAELREKLSALGVDVSTGGA